MGKTFRNGHGLKNGQRTGYKNGGRGRNRTSDCRHPHMKKGRK